MLRAAGSAHTTQESGCAAEADTIRGCCHDAHGVRAGLLLAWLQTISPAGRGSHRSTCSTRRSSPADRPPSRPAGGVSDRGRREEKGKGRESERREVERGGDRGGERRRAGKMDCSSRLTVLPTKQMSARSGLTRPAFSWRASPTCGRLQPLPGPFICCRPSPF